MKSKLNWALFIILACFWSGSFVGIKAAVNAWPPLFSATVRVMVGLICLRFMFPFKKMMNYPFSTLWRVWLTGICSQALPFAFLFWSENIISSGLAGILNGTVPIWTIILSFFFFPHFLQEFSLRKMLGLIIGIVGIVVVFWPMLSIDHHWITLLGALSVLIMAVFYALGGLLFQLFKDKIKIDFFANVFQQQLVSLVFLFVLSACIEPWPSMTSLFSAESHTAWMATLYLGIFSTAIAWMMYYHLIHEWGALRASSVLYVIPALALIWDYVCFSNVPQSFDVIGVIAILVGVFLINAKRFSKASLSLKPQPREMPLT